MKVLLIDDNPEFCSTMEDIVRSFGYETAMIHNPEEVMPYIEKYHKKIGAVLLDIEFGPAAKMNGLDLLEVIRRKYLTLPVVMISGKGTIETAVRATKLGAINFIEKSIITKEKIRVVLESALTKYASEGEGEEIRKFLAEFGIIGKSKKILEVGDLIIRFGRTDLNVLITGETGTGKKLVARAIHSVSRRAKSPFVTVDIPNIPKELFQSELFGHVKGSFSGATDNKTGLFQQANKGTLFLDEIGEMSLDLQSNLFIPIEERTVRRVGAVQNEQVDIRFISATDKDLLAGMRDNSFREQLYHRLRECEIHLPKLDSRREDIPFIVDYYVHKHNDEFNENKFISPSGVEYLTEQNWTGNVRELASVIKVALQTTQTEQIEVTDITSTMQSSSSYHGISNESTATLSSDRTLKEDLAEVDKRKVEATLRICGGNVSKSAALLGVSRETLHNKIRRYDINVQSFRVKAK